jgi:Flp pilus assembly protein TadG
VSIRGDSTYIKREDASTAVEFALLGIPFVFMLIGIIEVSLMFAANSVLQDAASQAARMIRTGQVQQSTSPEDAFYDEMCRVASVFLSCERIQYEVVTLPGGFGDAESNPVQLDADGNLISQGFDAGGTDDVVMIHTVYHYPMLTPFLGPLFSDTAGSSKLLMSTVVIQTEPYEFDMGG